MVTACVVVLSASASLRVASACNRPERYSVCGVSTLHPYRGAATRPSGVATLPRTNSFCVSHTRQPAVARAQPPRRGPSRCTSLAIYLQPPRLGRHAGRQPADGDRDAELSYANKSFADFADHRETGDVSRAVWDSRRRDSGDMPDAQAPGLGPCGHVCRASRRRGARRRHATLRHGSGSQHPACEPHRISFTRYSTI
jgi:hypothetical protein